MTRVVAVFDDLLLGSNVLGMLRAGGFEATLTAQLDAVEEAFTAGAGGFGRLRRDVLDAWADWDVEFGILQERPDVERAFDFSLVTRPQQP